MELSRIYVTQRRLRNPAQIADLIQGVGALSCLPPVRLGELEDGTVFIMDGHHRCLAYLFTGRITLYWAEFILFPVEFPRAIFGRLTDPTVIQRLLGK